MDKPSITLLNSPPFVLGVGMVSVLAYASMYLMAMCPPQPGIRGRYRSVAVRRAHVWRWRLSFAAVPDTATFLAFFDALSAETVPARFDCFGFGS